MLTDLFQLCPLAFDLVFSIATTLLNTRVDCPVTVLTWELIIVKTSRCKLALGSNHQW